MGEGDDAIEIPGGVKVACVRPRGSERGGGGAINYRGVTKGSEG